MTYPPNGGHPRGVAEREHTRQEANSSSTCQPHVDEEVVVIYGIRKGFVIPCYCESARN